MAEEKVIRIGLAGLGFMAATHLKASRQISGARIHAICNPSGRHLDGDLTGVGGNIGPNDPVKLDMSQVKATRNYQDLLDDPEIDLIDICSPTMMHAEMAIAALRAGKHVLCEKPLARTSAEAARIAEAAREAKTFCMPAMCLRFWPEWVWLKRAVAENTYGKVFSARFRRVAEPPQWGRAHFARGDASGGALLDLHIHDVDFVQFLFGPPSSVFASGYTKYTGAIDHVVAQYQVQGNAVVHAEGSWAMAPGFGFSMSYTVNFDRATADYDIARGPENALRLYEEGQPGRAIQCGGEDGYVGELRHIIDSIRAGKPPAVVTPDDGVMAIRICEAEEQSIRSGQPVKV